MRKNLHTSTLLLVGALAIVLISIPLYFVHRAEVVVAYLFSVLAIVLVDLATIILLRRYTKSFSWALVFPAKIITYLVCALFIYVILLFMPWITMTVTVVTELVVLILGLILAIPLISGIGEIRHIDEITKTSTSFVRESRLAIASSKGYSKEADALLNQVDEALRYSELNSNEDSRAIEAEISEELSSQIEAIKNGNSIDCTKLINDIAKRNEILRLSKRGTK